MNLFNKLSRWYLTRRALPYWIVLFTDLVVCYLAGIMVFWFYYRGAVTLGNIVLLTKTIVVYMIFNIVGFRMFHTYSGIIRYSSFVDLQRLAMAMGVNCAIAEIWHYFVYFSNMSFVRLEGRQILLMYVIATLMMWGLRVILKTLYDASLGGESILIYGISPALAKGVRNDKSMPFHLEGFISPRGVYENKRIMGLHVFMPNDGLRKVIRERKIKTVLVAPSESRRFRHNGELQDLLLSEGVKIQMWQGLRDWHEGDDFNVAQFKEVNVSDLLPRDEIQLDMTAIGQMLEGKKVMVTGSAGSIGSELVEQIASFHPSNLILVDQAETPQHDMRLLMLRKFPDIKCETIVVSITQKKRMEHIFSTFRPEYVFHAAAYKHVPMMEDNPCEAIYNNVYGTKVIADLSVQYGVRKMVMISTDKAVNPTSVMGCSKRICEIYCQSLDAKEGVKTDFVTTRFGNVLGSNGSVVPLFEKEIREGGPVTVTHPDVIRYFMLIPEACKLVLEAATQGKGGQIFVFDMGEPVKIADLAKRMISLSGRKDIKIVYTGLRPGEKLYEEVLANEETTLPAFNPKIRIAKVRQYDFEDVSKEIDELVHLSMYFDGDAVIKKMQEMVPEYTHKA